MNINSRIKSGFDVEVNIGVKYIERIIEGAYKSGQIPSIISFKNKAKTEKIYINKPTKARIVFPKDKKSDLEVTVPIRYKVFKIEAKIYLKLNFLADGIQLKYIKLDSKTIKLLEFIERVGQIKDLVKKVNTKLKEALNKKFKIDFLSQSVDQFKFVKVRGYKQFQSTFVLLVNLKLKINPQNKSPERKYIPRGNSKKVQSILLEERYFYVGINKKTFTYFSNHAWHQLGVKTNNKITHPLIVDKVNKGEIKSISIKPKENFIEIDFRILYNIDWWADADVKAVFKLKPKIKNQRIDSEMKLVHFDADTGLLGDLFAFFLLGIPGIVTLEILENVLASSNADTVENSAKANLNSALSAFPNNIELFTLNTDEFYKTKYDVQHIFNSITCTTEGLSFGGNSKIIKYFTPNESTIIDKTRKKVGKKTILDTLIYKTIKTKKIRSFKIKEVFKNRKENKLPLVKLKATKINRNRGVVTHIQFNSGLDLRTDEAIRLQKKKLLELLDLKLITPKKGNPYFRSKKDDDESNNFEKLPAFNPKEP